MLTPRVIAHQRGISAATFAALLAADRARNAPCAPSPCPDDPRYTIVAAKGTARSLATGRGCECTVFMACYNGARIGEIQQRKDKVSIAAAIEEYRRDMATPYRAEGDGADYVRSD